MSNFNFYINSFLKFLFKYFQNILNFFFKNAYINLNVSYLSDSIYIL